MREHFTQSYNKYIQFRRQNLIMDPDKGVKKHLFSAIYRLGYIPKKRKGEQNIRINNDTIQFKTFILTLGMVKSFGLWKFGILSRH